LALFRKPHSPYWWYSFYFEGERFRQSTKQKTKSAAAAVEAAKLVELQESGPDFLRTRKSPTLKEFSTRFLEWVEKTQRLRPSGKKYYRYGWRLLEFSALAGMRLNRIGKDEAECTIFNRPVLVNKKMNETKMVPCSSHYTNQALRTLKRMQSKALEWKVLRSVPKITLAEAEGRDRIINEETEDQIQQAYAEPSNHPRTRRLRQQAWLVMVIMQDSGMRPDEVFSMTIENIRWGERRIWVPHGKTKKARRFVAMSDRMEEMLRNWCGARTEGWVFPSPRSASGHLTTIAKGFQAVRDRAGLDKKIVPYLARHTYGTYTMAKTRNTFAVADSMGHVDLKSMEPYQHQELEPLRAAINERNQATKERQHQQISAGISRGHIPGHTGQAAD
jgi:integrase